MIMMSHLNVMSRRLSFNYRRYLIIFENLIEFFTLKILSQTLQAILVKHFSFKIKKFHRFKEVSSWKRFFLTYFYKKKSRIVWILHRTIIFYGNFLKFLQNIKFFFMTRNVFHLWDSETYGKVWDFEHLCSKESEKSERNVWKNGYLAFFCPSYDSNITFCTCTTTL